VDEREIDAELGGLTPGQRIRKCRVMAHQARNLAQGANGELRTGYERIAATWEMLAEEIDRGTK